DEVTMFEKDVPVSTILKKVMDRMIREAYQQGGVLSTRDLSLLLVFNGSGLSRQRIEFEKEHQTILPHAGVIHDMGTTLTHKRIIVYKHVVEKKDPTIVARETNHSQPAVDKYLKDFNRVKTLVYDNKDIDFIHHTTNIAKPVVKQYLQIINKYVKER
ncbi:MAG: hypothetical protein H6Q23_431, partial [Bacteroidetes bacterium]|nr:hypothetical protein [Bacteroidota bacterium]